MTAVSSHLKCSRAFFSQGYDIGGEQQAFYDAVLNVLDCPGGSWGSQNFKTVGLQLRRNVFVAEGLAPGVPALSTCSISTVGQ